jgi:ankyrin repeat protein
MFRPPLLTVDTSTLEEDADHWLEPIVPRTPANVRSMHRTELHAAVVAANVEEARRLLEEGHAVDPQEEHGFTPLHNAAALPEKAAARAALVELLLHHAADTCRADNEGYTCLHWAAACGHANVVSPLRAWLALDPSPSGWPSHCLLAAGPPAAQKTEADGSRLASAVAAGAKPSQRSHTGETPLHRAGALPNMI